MADTRAQLLQAQQPPPAGAPPCGSAAAAAASAVDDEAWGDRLLERLAGSLSAHVDSALARLAHALAAGGGGGGDGGSGVDEGGVEERASGGSAAAPLDAQPRPTSGCASEGDGATAMLADDDGAAPPLPSPAATGGEGELAEVQQQGDVPGDTVPVPRVQLQALLGDYEVRLQLLPSAGWKGGGGGAKRETCRYSPAPRSHSAASLPHVALRVQAAAADVQVQARLIAKLKTSLCELMHEYGATMANVARVAALEERASQAESDGE